MFCEIQTYDIQLLRFVPCFLFLSQFLPDLDENYIKIKLNSRGTRLLSWSVFEPVAIGLKTVSPVQFVAVFLFQIWMSWTMGKTETGPSPVRFQSFSSPMEQTFKH